MNTYPSGNLLPTDNTESLFSDITDEIQRIRELLQQMPEGTANAFISSGRLRIKGTLNGKAHFYNRSELPLAKQLIYKKYLETRRDELLHCQIALKAQSDFEQNWRGKSEMFLMENPERAALLSEFFTDQNHPLYEWMSAPNCCAAPYQELRTEDSPAGYKVRSKSEVMAIAVLLEQNRFFRYEDPLYLNGTFYYPDFTIRNPKDGKYYWYEHFGKMDDPEYARKTYAKLAVYASCGIIPSVNLITTFETKAQKLNIPHIKQALSILDM